MSIRNQCPIQSSCSLSLSCCISIQSHLWIWNKFLDCKDKEKRVKETKAISEREREKTKESLNEFPIDFWIFVMGNFQSKDLLLLLLLLLLFLYQFVNKRQHSTSNHNETWLSVRYVYLFGMTDNQTEWRRCARTHSQCEKNTANKWKRRIDGCPI